MLKVITAATLLLSAAAPAMAQYYTTPNIYGQPQYGTTTTGPGGSWQTTPNIYGHPEFGTTSSGPNGQQCESTPNIYGQPQYGTTTTCN